MDNKRAKMLTLMALVLLTIAVIGATYAYFQAQAGGTTSRNINVTSNTTDSLSFQISNDISFTVTQAAFAENAGNRDGYATATAVLTPNNNTGAATMNYYMYLNLESNPTVYSEANTNELPELMLQVFDSSNQLVTLTGLGNQVTVGSITGYDITGVEEILPLLSNHTISASNNTATTETWRVVVTLINHNFNQNDNTGKTIEGSIIVRKTEITYCSENPNEFGCQIDLTYNPSTSGNTITLTNGYIYHHDSTLTNGAGDGSWRYTGANPNNYVCFGSNAATCPDNNIYRIIGLVSVSVVTDNTTNPVTTETQTLYKIIKNDYLTSAEVSTGVGTYNSSNHPSTYNGPSGNQYVSDPQGYYWSGSSSNQSNTWSSSTLNTNGLNGSYLTSLGSTWENKIATVMWKVGGGDNSYIKTATPMSTVYTNEITESGQHATNVPTDGKNEYAAKVGLMYVSDYGYAAPSTSWSTDPGSYNGSTIIANNWLYRGVYEWTVSRLAGNTLSAYDVYGDGGVKYNGVYGYAFGVRPVLYLNSSTIIDMSNHAGTISDPYRIS